MDEITKICVKVVVLLLLINSGTHIDLDLIMGITKRHEIKIENTLRLLSLFSVTRQCICFLHVCCTKIALSPITPDVS